MAQDQYINILVKLNTNDLKKGVNEVKGQLDKVNQSSTKSNQGMLKGFRDQIAPLNLLIRTISRVGFIAGAVFGAFAGSVIATAREIDELDKLAIKLGTTTEELSRRIYGFNIKTGNALLGVGFGKALGQNTEKGLKATEGAFTNVLGYIRKAWRTTAQLIEKTDQHTTGSLIENWRKYWNTSQQQLTEEDKLRKENAKETILIEGEVTDKIKQLSLSTYQYKAYQLDQEVSLLKQAGVKKSQIEEYYAQQTEENLRTRLGFKKFMDVIDNEFKSGIGIMENTMTSFLTDAFTGDLKTAKEYFASFAKSIMGMIAQMIAKLTMLAVFKAIFGTMTGGVGFLFHEGGVVGSGGQPIDLGRIDVSKKFHSGGVVRAHNGLAVDEVPIIAQTGEGVLSRKGMRSLGRNKFNKINNGEDAGEGTTINNQPVIVIQAWDTTDIMRNSKSIEGIIASALARNSRITRDAVKHYG